MQSASYITVRHPRQFICELREFYCIFCAWNGRAELLRLVTWAASRKLEKQRQWYHFLLEKQELRLQHYRARSPKKTIWAYRLHRLAKTLNHRPYYPPGSARHYRSRQIDNRSYQCYIKHDILQSLV